MSGDIGKCLERIGACFEKSAYSRGQHQQVPVPKRALATV
jgi:hypothetical protein